MSGKRKRDQNTDPTQPLRLTERALTLADDITDPSVRGSMLTLLLELKVSIQVWLYSIHYTLLIIIVNPSLNEKLSNEEKYIARS